MNESYQLELPKVDSQVLENPPNNIFLNSKSKFLLLSIISKTQDEAELEDMQTLRPLKYDENERNSPHDQELDLELFSQNKRVENKSSLSFFSRAEKKKGTLGKSKGYKIDSFF